MESLGKKLGLGTFAYTHNYLPSSSLFELPIQHFFFSSKSHYFFFQSNDKLKIQRIHQCRKCRRCKYFIHLKCRFYSKKFSVFLPNWMFLEILAILFSNSTRFLSFLINCLETFSYFNLVFQRDF